MERILELFRKHKKPLTLGVLAVLALSIPIVVAQVLKQQDIRQRAAAGDPVTLSFSPLSGNKQIGDEFDVQLKINTNTNDISAIDGYIRYDDTRLLLLSKTAGTPYSEIYGALTDRVGTTGVRTKEQRITLYNQTSSVVTGSDKVLGTFRFRAIANGTAGVTFGTPPEGAFKIAASGFAGNVPTTDSSNTSSSFIIGTGTTVTSTPTGTQATPTVDPNYNSTLTPPTNLRPQGNINPGLLELRWDASPMSTGGYFVRLTDETTSEKWDTDCVNQKAHDGIGPFPTTGGLCRIMDNTSYPPYEFKAGHRYSWWVHTRSTDGKFGPATTTVNVTASSSTLPTATIVPTGTIVPTATLIPTTTLAPGDTSVTLKVQLPGIGNGPVTLGLNSAPVHPQRNTTIQILNVNDLPVKTVTGLMTYDSNGAFYKGVFALGPTFPSGSYNVKVKFENTLYKIIPGIIQITSGQNSAQTVPPVALTSGDLNGDNTLGIIDWTFMINCVLNKAECTANMRALADLNDNGSVDELDLQILQRGFALRNGD